jgi:hypothetical protein
MAQAHALTKLLLIRILTIVLDLIAISWQVKNVGIHLLASLQMTHVEIMIINAE